MLKQNETYPNLNVRIGFVLYDYYPYGGLQEDCLATALAVQAREHEVHIFTRTWKGELPKVVKAHILGKKGWSNLSRNQYFFESLSNELLDHQLDGVVAFNRIPESSIYFAADPCFVERQKDLPWWRKLSLRYRYYAKLEASIFKGLDSPETLVLTQREISAFHKHYDVPKERFHLLPPGVERINTTKNVRLENRAKLRKEIGTHSEATVALFVGSGFRIKGLDRALSAIKANRKSAKLLEFWIVGNGKEARYKRMANESGVTVHFLGGQSDVARFYDAADFLLHPAYSESAGKVLLEALTHGLPVLTTDTCGYAPHIIKADGGIVIKSPFTQTSLNDSLVFMIQDINTRESWSQNALQYAASNDLYSCHKAAAMTIEQIIEKNN